METLRKGKKYLTSRQILLRSDDRKSLISPISCIQPKLNRHICIGLFFKLLIFKKKNLIIVCTCILTSLTVAWIVKRAIFLWISGLDWRQDMSCLNDDRHRGQICRASVSLYFSLVGVVLSVSFIRVSIVCIHLYLHVILSQFFLYLADRLSGNA